jgi:hypothetical protein
MLSAHYTKVSPFHRGYSSANNSRIKKYERNGRTHTSRNKWKNRNTYIVLIGKPEKNNA